MQPGQKSWLVGLAAEVSKQASTNVDLLLACLQKVAVKEVEGIGVLTLLRVAPFAAAKDPVEPASSDHAGSSAMGADTAAGSGGSASKKSKSAKSATGREDWEESEGCFSGAPMK